MLEGKGSLMKFELLGDHIIPFTLLTLDYIFNVVPFCWRHFPFVLFFGFVYLVVNFIYTKETGHPPYPALDWETTSGWLWVLGFAAIFVVTFLLLKLLTDCKLVKNGFSTCVNSMKDELHIRKHTNIEEVAHQKDAFGLYNHYEPSRFQSINLPGHRTTSLAAPYNQNGS
jgi:hypothetical protein